MEFLGNAMGTHGLKVGFNPMMIQCLHPHCTKKGARPVKLKKIFDISQFLDHLKDHFNKIGDAMQARFEAVHKDKSLSTKELDKIAPSPYSLVNQKILLEEKTVECMNRYAINRKYKENYICHWKNILINSGSIQCSSLSFQEDDARIHMALHFPNPGKNWTNWNALFWYALKMFTSISSAAVNLSWCH